MTDINASTGQQIRDLIRKQNEQHIQLADWLGGNATGGPNADGKYPLSDGLGRTTMVPSPARFEDRVSGPAGQALDAMYAATTARDQAKASELEATVQKQLADAARGAAVDARNLAQEHRNHAGTHEANARYWAEQAGQHGQGSGEDRAVVEQLASEVAINASDAAQDAEDAAASAALAATFDPSLYDRKADTLAASRLTGLIDPARIPILPSQKQFASSGGLTNLSTAQQNEIGQGSIVTTTDGRRFVYSGTGSKTVEASYVVLADVTPEWASIADKPSFFPSNIANVSGLQSALDGKASMADITWTNSNVSSLQTAKANLTGGNVFKDTQKIEATSSQWGLWIESNANVTGGNYANGVEVVISSYQPRIMFHDRSTNAKHMIQHYDSGGMNWQYDTDGDGLYSDRLMRLQGNGTLALKTGNALTTGTGVQISTTNLGRTDNVPLISGTRNAAWWAGLPTGYNVMTNLTTANGSPINGYGYFMKMARRDADNGWCGIWQGYHGSEMYFGRAETNTVQATWYRLWNSGNFNPDSKLNNATATWIADADGHQRFNFGVSGTTMGVTYVRGNTVEIRGTANTRLFAINNVGAMNMISDVWHYSSDGKSRLYFQAVDGLTVIRGNGVSFRNESNGENASISSGGAFNAGGDIQTWGGNFRVQGTSNGIIWNVHGGGWTMTDTTWMRVHNNKNILTTGTVQMGAFTVTSDRRIKTDFAPIKSTGSIIDQTDVYEFTKNGRRQLGVIAQEANEIVPILVSEGGELHTDGTPLLTVDMTGYIPILIEEVKGLRSRVAELEDER